MKTYSSFLTDSTKEPTFDRSNLPDAAKFSLYSKKEPVKAMRIEGPFTVKTREGVVRTTDGWLAIDHHGWPYPIDDDEFKAIYKEVSE